MTLEEFKKERLSQYPDNQKMHMQMADWWIEQKEREKLREEFVKAQVEYQEETLRMVSELKAYGKK